MLRLNDDDVVVMMVIAMLLMAMVMIVAMVVPVMGDDMAVLESQQLAQDNTQGEGVTVEGTR